MTSELSFLLDLLLNQRMPLATKELVVARIKEVEEGLRSPLLNYPPKVIPTQGIQQAPSTQAILNRNPDLAAVLMPTPEMPPVPAPAPVAMVAQTAPAVAAMNARNQAIQESLSGKIDKQRGSPRKF